MRFLITGMWIEAERYIPILREHGHEVLFMPGRMDAESGPLPCDPGWPEAIICTALFQFHPVEAFTNLKYVQVCSTGLNRVPVDYLREHGIALYNAGGAYSIPMAEFIVGGILQVYKGANYFNRNRAARVWRKTSDLLELTEKTVVIVGTGDVGRETAKRLKGFDCHLVGVNRTPREVPYFDELLPLTELKNAAERADILICAIALTEETRGMFNREVFSKLKDGAVFVNVARGPIADERDLIEWLQSDRSLGAVLDVFENEPLPQESPLWDMEKVIMAPHNSWASEKINRRLSMNILRNLGITAE